ncbi:hypothetical protein M758_3G166400 [Ceratodon purpureus]|nr:hypothetical protein M758_3G166400 [Ceratodon purpureus]
MVFIDFEGLRLHLQRRDLERERGSRPHRDPAPHLPIRPPGLSPNTPASLLSLAPSPTPASAIPLRPPTRPPLRDAPRHRYCNPRATSLTTGTQLRALSNEPLRARFGLLSSSHYFSFSTSSGCRLLRCSAEGLAMCIVECGD